MALINGLISAQAIATRDPDQGKVWLEDVKVLDYVYNDTGAALDIPIPASAADPVYVVDVEHLVRTAFTGGTPTIDVGDGVTAGYYIANTAVTEGTAGDLVRSVKGLKLAANGVIRVTIGGGPTAGAGSVIARLFRVQ